MVCFIQKRIATCEVKQKVADFEERMAQYRKRGGRYTCTEPNRGYCKHPFWSLLTAILSFCKALRQPMDAELSAKFCKQTSFLYCLVMDYLVRSILGSTPILIIPLKNTLHSSAMPNRIFYEQTNQNSNDAD